MPGMFKTWDEIASYIDNIKGYKYLDNPTSWIDAFKETVKDSRLVDVVNDAGEFIETTFFNSKWIGTGDWNAPGLETGEISVPTINNVVTNTATGTAVIGETALATEAVGITIELSVAGYFATALTGLGLGVASYEIFPEFYTDISNYVFGTNLTYDETEPFLRKKLKTLLTTDENGKPLTYIPEELVERTYDFIKTHLNVTSVSNTFPSAVIDDTTGAVTGNRQQTMPYLDKTTISRDDMQQFMNSCAEVYNQRGYTNIRALNVSELFNEIQSNYSLNDYDLITYQCEIDPAIWNNGMRTVDGQGHVAHFGINAYKLTEQQKSDSIILQKARKFTDINTGFISNISPAVLDKDPDVCGSVFINIPANGDEATYDVLTTANGLTGGMRSDHDKAFSNGGLQRYVGLYPDASSDPYDNQFTGFLNNPQHYYLRYSNPIEEEIVEKDDYLGDKAVITGRTPKNGVPFAERFPARQIGKKQTSQPDKNGADTQQNYIKSTTPIGDRVTDQVIKHGINNDDADSYKEDQDTNHKGDNTPDKSSADDVNDSVDESIKDYNKSRTSPETAPYPAPETRPLPDYPTNPPSEPDGKNDDPTDPVYLPGVTASGMVSVYNPTKAQVVSFSSWLWTGNVFENMKKLLQDPMEAIIGMHIMYATPHTTSPSNIIVGWLDSGVAAKVVDKQYTSLDCGTIQIPEYYGDARDYEPYVQIHLYLPFVGIVSLKPNDVIGKSVNVTYGIDALTGTCLAMVTTTKGSSKIQCYTFPGNCAVQIPLTGGNYAQILRGVVSMAVGVAGSAATGNPIGAVGGILTGAMSAHVDVAHSGTLGANAGAMGVKKPYVIITRKVAYDAASYNQFYGYPANKTVTLGACRGYTRVKSVHIESIPIATSDEKQQIEALLKQGVIIR